MDVLVTVEHAGGTAAIGRADGMAWLTGDLARGPSTGLREHGSSREGLEHGSVHGGLLPPGATTARVRDAAGEEHVPATGAGAWVLVLEQSPDLPIAVRSLDATGAVVRPPLPERWPREPVTDAAEPCPACDGTAWEHVTPDENRHGASVEADGTEIPSTFVVCVRCGHEEAAGGFISVSLPEGEVGDSVASSRWERQWERRVAKALAGVRFPVYAPEGLAVSLGGWSGSERKPPSSVTLVHGEQALTVETEHGGGPGTGLVRALANVLDEPAEWPERSDAGRSIWLEAQERRRQRIAAGAVQSARSLPVDGVPVPFAFLQAGECWVAEGQLGEERIALAARGVPFEAVRLRALEDLTRLDVLTE